MIFFIPTPCDVWMSLNSTYAVYRCDVQVTVSIISWRFTGLLLHRWLNRIMWLFAGVTFTLTVSFNCWQLRYLCWQHWTVTGVRSTSTASFNCGQVTCLLTVSFNFSQVWRVLTASSDCWQVWLSMLTVTSSCWQVWLPCFHYPLPISRCDVHVNGILYLSTGVMHYKCLWNGQWDRNGPETDECIEVREPARWSNI